MGKVKEMLELRACYFSHFSASDDICAYNEPCHDTQFLSTHAVKLSPYPLITEIAGMTQPIAKKLPPCLLQDGGVCVQNCTHKFPP